MNVTPLGSAPLSVSVAAGLPVLVTENVPAVPAVNVVGVAAGDGRRLRVACTVSVNAWVALEPTPFAAVIVIG